MIAAAVTFFFFFWPTERRQQGKFQPFRRLFGKRKKRERERDAVGAAELKASLSTGEVCNGVVSDDEENLRSVLLACVLIISLMLTMCALCVCVSFREIRWGWVEWSLQDTVNVHRFHLNFQSCLKYEHFLCIRLAG